MRSSRALLSDAMLVLAHAGHWLAQLMYVVPVVGIVAWLGVTTYRDRHRRADEAAEPEDGAGRSAG